MPGVTQQDVECLEWRSLDKADARRVAFEANGWECSASRFPELVIVLYGFWDCDLLPRERRIPDALPFAFPVKNLSSGEQEFFRQEPATRRVLFPPCFPQLDEENVVKTESDEFGYIHGVPVSFVLSLIASVLTMLPILQSARYENLEKDFLNLFDQFGGNGEIRGHFATLIEQQRPDLPSASNYSADVDKLRYAFRECVRLNRPLAESLAKVLNDIEKRA